MTLIELIPVGSESRITSAEISQRLGISGAEVRKQVNQLRCDGTAIAPLHSSICYLWLIFIF